MKTRVPSRHVVARPLARAIAFARCIGFAGFVLAASAGAQTDTCRLYADTTVISLSAGQVQHLRLSAPGHAFNPARVFGSFAGTTPGIEEIAGLMPHVHLPLNRDRYFWMTWNGTSPLLANPPGVPTGPFAGFVPLDINGRATTVVSVPPALHSVFVGRTVHHAFVTRSIVPIGFDCASNSIALTFAP